MTREVSRRTSIPPEQKGKVVRPDMAKTPRPIMEDYMMEIDRDKAIQRGRDMDHYVGSINPVEGNLSRSTGYVDNNDGRGGKNAKRK
jgi:hypothetical protein